MAVKARLCGGQSMGSRHPAAIRTSASVQTSLSNLLDRILSTLECGYTRRGVRATHRKGPSRPSIALVVAFRGELPPNLASRRVRVHGPCSSRKQHIARFSALSSFSATRSACASSRSASCALAGCCTRGLVPNTATIAIVLGYAPFCS